MYTFDTFVIIPRRNLCRFESSCHFKKYPLGVDCIIQVKILNELIKNTNVKYEYSPIYEEIPMVIEILDESSSVVTLPGIYSYNYLPDFIEELSDNEANKMVSKITLIDPDSIELKIVKVLK